MISLETLLRQTTTSKGQDLSPKDQDSQPLVLFISVGDATAGKVVRRHLYAHAISNKYANAILAHLSGHCGQHYVIAVIELHFEKSVGLLVDDYTLCWN
jgi:uncharacterized protein YjlB